MTATPAPPTSPAVSTAGAGSASITVNGEQVAIAAAGAHTTTLDWLRSRGLTGAKEGCAEGECGACSVLVARAGTGDEPTQWTALNACLVPVAALDGQEIVTSEGLADGAELHPVQREMADRGGSQCGYCTPGFVCSMAAEFYREGRGCGAAAKSGGCARNGAAAHGSDSQTHQTTGTSGVDTGTSDSTTDTANGTSSSTTVSVTTNRSLIKAARALPSDRQDEEPLGEHGPNGFDLHALSGNLCRCTGYRPIRDAAYALGDPDADDPLAQRRQSPPPAPVATRLEIDGAEFIRATDLATATSILAERPQAQLLAGATDWGVEVNIRARRAPLVLAVDQIPELREFTVGDTEVRIGAGLSLSEIERRLDGRIPLLAQLFPQFASRLIRNGATFGGNLGTGSPIGDSPPALLALDAKLLLTSVRGDREVPLAEYFTGYRKTVKADDELIRAVVIPLPVAPITAFHKIAKRRFDDISSVAVGYALDVDGTNTVTSVKIGLGGVAATPLRATATEQALLGGAWTQESVSAAAAVLATEGTPMDDHRASASYRAAMLAQSLRRLFADNPHPSSNVTPEVH